MISVNLLIVSSWEAGDSALQIDRKHIETARTKLSGIFVQFQPKIKEFLACLEGDTPTRIAVDLTHFTGSEPLPRGPTEGLRSIRVLCCQPL